jgi:predicted amidohydrolase
VNTMESQRACDLLLYVKQWFDGFQLHNSPLQLAITNGVLVYYGPKSNWHTNRLIESDGILLPAVTDLHTHPDHYASRFGSDPDRYSLYTGVNQVVSQGDAGALGAEEFVARVIIPSQTNVEIW